METSQYGYENLPPETELLTWYLAQLSSMLEEQGASYSITELYDDLPTRAYLMMRVFDELDFCTLYPAKES